MSNEYDTHDLRSLGFEPEDLDGHTIEDLTDYLDAGRNPPDPSIDASPGCRLALDALERLRDLTPELLSADSAVEPEVEEGWVQKILTGITLDARAGRRIPFSASGPHADLGITEGAVRGLMRAAESAVPGVLVGRCRLDGEITEPGAPIRACVEVSVPYGPPIPLLAERLRAEIATSLGTHTELNITGVDVVVQDVRRRSPPVEEGR